MTFDPKAYLKEKTAESFDPQAYLQEKSQPQPSAKPSTQGRAALEGFGQGATLGYLPQIQAATQLGADKVIGAHVDLKDRLVKLIGKPEWQSEDAKLREMGAQLPESETYTQLRDKNISRQNMLAEENPMTYGGASLAGAVASAAIPSTLAAKLGLLAGTGKAVVTADQAAKLTRSAKALGAGKRIAQGAATGASYGLVANPGDVAGEVAPIQLDKRLQNAKTGAVVGALASGGVETIGGLAKGAANKARGFAETKAFKALGGTKSANKAANAKGTTQQIGRTLLDEKVVTPLATPKTIAGRLETMIDDAASAIDDAIQKIDDGSAQSKLLKPDQRAKLEGSFFRPKEVAENLKAKIRAQYDQIPEAKLAPAMKEVDEWFSGKPDVIGIKDLQKFKKQMNAFLKNSDFYKPMAEQSFSKQGTLAVREGVKEGIEKQADTVAELLGGQGGQIKGANKRLGQLLEADKIVTDKVNRDAANRSMSLTDYLSAIAGSKYGPVGFAASAVGNKFARTFGNSLMATGADNTAKALMKVPQAAELAQRNPEAFQALVNRMAIGQKNEGGETAIQRRLKEQK